MKFIFAAQIPHPVFGLIFLHMMTMGSDRGGADAMPARKRGAPKGNRNAWKHGKRSAAAKAARAAARERVIARLPDRHLLAPALALAEAIHAEFEGEVKLARLPATEAEGILPSDFSKNKTNNSVAQPEKAGEGVPPAHFSKNKTNNSVAPPGKAGEGIPPSHFSERNYALRKPESIGSG